MLTLAALLTFRPLPLDPRSAELLRAALRQKAAPTVMLAVSRNAFDGIVQELGKGVRAADRELGYVRAEVSAPEVEALRSRTGVESVDLGNYDDQPWYTIPPLAPGVIPPVPVQASTPPLVDPSRFAVLAREMGRLKGFDGRGVTIAIVDRTPDLLSPCLRGKFAGVIGGVDDAPFWVPMNRTASGHFVVDGKAYDAPHLGEYRFGQVDASRIGALIHRKLGNVGILWDGARVWVDADDNGLFDERPLRPGEIGTFGEDDPGTPERETLGFAVETSKKGVRLLVGVGDHGTMMAGVAAGVGFPGRDNLSAAPGAKILSVDDGEGEHGILEAVIRAARDARVDVVCNAGGTSAKDWPLGRIVLARLRRRYPKPIFMAAGNSTAFDIINAYATPSDATAVSAALSAEGWRTNFGAEVRTTGLLPAVSYGPGADGGLKPDFLAPSGSLTASPEFETGGSLPGLYRLPPGYAVFSGTSCAAPMAAGAAAVLIQAARHARIPCDGPRLERALRASARFLPGVPAHRQGAGLIDLPAAWRELQKPDEDHVAFRAHVRTAEYDGPGTGLFEREGWAVGDRRTREVWATRLSGAPGRTLDVALTGDDGTFAVPARLAFPRGVPVRFPLTVAPKTPGAHSALVELRDPRTHRLVDRTLATVVAAIPLPYRATLSVPRPDTTDLFFRVPPGAGVLRVSLAAPVDGLVVYVHSPSREYAPRDSRLVNGRWRGDFPQPEPGIWEVVLRNAPDLRAHNPRPGLLPPTPVTVSVDAPRR